MSEYIETRNRRHRCGYSKVHLRDYKSKWEFIKTYIRKKMRSTSLVPVKNIITGDWMLKCNACLLTNDKYCGYVSKDLAYIHANYNFMCDKGLDQENLEENNNV